MNVVCKKTPEMTTYNNHQQRHEDIDASSQQQQSHEYFKREKRPPYFTSILNDGDASSVKENGFSVGDFRENNGNSREEGILSPKKTNSVGDTDSLAGEFIYLLFVSLFVSYFLCFKTFYFPCYAMLCYTDL